MADPPTPALAPALALETSWTANAQRWTDAVRTGAIASRRQGTDAAIVAAAAARRPTRVLDLGCGEGWLARALSARGIEVIGVDASAPLIAAARAAGSGHFLVADYDQLAHDPAVAGGGYDLIVANFALLQQDLLGLLRALRQVLAPGGAVMIQTVHSPLCGPPYHDGWRTEEFRDFGSVPWQPMPWYFRTLASWLGLLRASGYVLVDLQEPVSAATQMPLSLLLTAEPG